MTKSRSLALYNPRVRQQGSPNSALLLVGIAVLGLLVYLLLKNRQPAPALGFRNSASWDISYGPDGLPSKIKVTRDVQPQ